MEAPTALPVAPPPPAAPAPSAPAPTPEQAAFEKKDFSAWQAAKKAGNTAPPPAPEAKAEPPAPAAPPPPKKITLTQDELNARTRRAVEEALKSAEQARTAAPPAPPTEQPKPPAPPPAEKFPSIEEWSKTHPEGTLNDYLDARDTFRDEQRATAARRDAETRGRLTEMKTRADSFRQNVQAAIAADPQFLNAIPEEIIAAKPFSALSREDIHAGKATIANVAAEAALRSSDAARFLRHLKANPAEANRIGQLSPGEWLVEFIALDRSLGVASAPAQPSPAAAPSQPAAPPSTITAAPPPPETLTRPSSVVDPEAAAFKGKNFAEWQQIQNAKRKAKFTGAA